MRTETDSLYYCKPFESASKLLVHAADVFELARPLSFFRGIRLRHLQGPKYR